MLTAGLSLIYNSDPHNYLPGPISLLTSSASLRRLSARPWPDAPPAAAAPLLNFVKIMANAAGLTAAYDIDRIEGSMYAATASESMMLMV